MRIIPTSLLAGFGAVAFAGAVAAQGLPTPIPTHVMNLALPDGGTVQIRYSGPVAPRVSVAPPGDAASFPTAFPAAFWGADPIFARMAQLSAAMDRQSDAMLRQAAALMALPFPAAAGPDGVMRIDAARLPPGTQSYRLSETLSPGGVCRQSMAITSAGPGAKPHVVTHRSGTCGGAENSVAVPDATPDTTAPWQPRGMLQVKAKHAAPPSYVREAMYQPRG